MTGSRPAETAPPRLGLSSASSNPCGPTTAFSTPGGHAALTLGRAREWRRSRRPARRAEPRGDCEWDPGRSASQRERNSRLRILGPGENERGVREGPRYTPTGTTLRNSVTLWRILSGRAAAKGWCYRLRDRKGIRYPGTSRSLRAQSGTGTSAVTRRLCISLDGTLTAADFAERVRLGPRTPRSGSAESRGAAQTLGHGPSPTSLSRPFSRPLGP